MRVVADKAVEEAVRGGGSETSNGLTYSPPFVVSIGRVDVFESFAVRVIGWVRPVCLSSLLGITGWI